MKVEFSISTKVQTYKAIINVNHDEHALLIHLKHKLQQAYENSDYEDNFNVNLEVIEK